jgi:putative ABC transport system permease protein
MQTRDLFKTSISSLNSHKSRSALTILGIIIGITSIILVMSLGQSAQGLILQQIQSFGPTNLFILPGRASSNPGSFGQTLLSDSLKQKDFEDLQNKANVPDAVAVIPINFGPVVVSYGNQTYNTQILGSDYKAKKLFNLPIALGDFFTKSDVNSRSDVVVLGSKIANELFGASNPIGQKVKIKNKSFRVVGVLDKKGQSFIDFDTAVVAPYTTTQQYILGIRHFQRIVVEVSSLEAIPGAIKDITRVLRQNHNITNPDKDDFTVRTQQDVVNTVSNVIDILTLLLSLVAAISLVVGGVGIMNIMLVSVTERTREIGIRKALGATNKDILNQFLVEAVLLTSIGGILGIVFGTILGWAVSFVATNFLGINFPFIFSLKGAVIGVSVSTLIGIIFGIFPASQAAKKSPVEALRYE